MTEKRRLAESEIRGKRDEEVWLSEKTLLIQPSMRKNSGASDLEEEDDRKWLSCSRTGNMARHSAPSIEVQNFPEGQNSTKREENANPVSSAASSPSPGLATSVSGQLLTPNSPGSDRERSSSTQHNIILSSSSSQSKIKQPVITGLERTPSIPAVLISRVRDRIQDKVIHTSKWQAVAAVVQERRQRAANDYIFKNSSTRNNWQQVQQKLHLLHQHKHQNIQNSAHDSIELESMKDQKLLTRVRSDPSQQEILPVSALRKRRDGSVVSTTGFLDEGPSSTARSSITSDQFPSKNKMSKSTSISGSRSILGEPHKTSEKQGVVCSGADFEDILSNYNSHIKPLLTNHRKANSQSYEDFAKFDNAIKNPTNGSPKKNLEFDPQVMGDAIEVYLEHKVCTGRRKRSSQQRVSLHQDSRRHSFDEEDDVDDGDEESLNEKESKNCVHIFSLFCSFSTEKPKRGTR